MSTPVDPSPSGARSPAGDPVLCAATDGPEATRALGSALAEVLVDGDLLVLTGDLGAGKTCLTQGLGAGLGVDERITSPTFTLVAEYRGRLRLHHLDVYRLDGPADALDLDLRELAEDGVTVVEWGERVEPALGADRLVVELTFPDLGLAPADGPVGDGAAGVGAPGDGVAGDGVAGDDHRRFRCQLVGDRWTSRTEALTGALAPWAAPC